MKFSSSSARAQRGLTLLESLVAMVVAGAGVLGIVGMQLRTLSDTQNSVRRAQAILLIDDLTERMRVNPNALVNISNYVIGWDTADGTDDPPLTPQAGKLCDTNTCTAAELAKYDTREWKRRVESTLPLGDASVFWAPGEEAATNRRQLGVMIRWRENERSIDDEADRSKYQEGIDLTKQVESKDGKRTVTDLGGSAVQCSGANGAAYTCHLQYIPVSARCAAYHGDGSVAYYCPEG